MTDERLPCAQHPQMMEWFQELLSKMGKHDAHIQTSLDNQKEIFEKLTDIKSVLDQRTVVNLGMDKQLITLSEVAKQNQENIGKLRTVVENGLTDRTKTIETSVSCLRDCMEKIERRRQVKEAVSEAGIQGFFAKSWEEVKLKIGPMIIYLIIGTLVWSFVKVVIFKELPFQLSRQAVVDQIISNEDRNADETKQREKKD